MTAMDLNLHARLRKRAAEPSALLSFLAGDHAPAIAAVWPQPHEGFLVLPTARRHAAAMRLAGFGAEIATDPVAIKSDIERARDEVIANQLVGRDHSAGLMKALRKAGEVLWTGQVYTQFLTMFREPGANRILRHMPEISPVVLEPITVLPPILREAKIVSHLVCRDQAEDIAFALDLIAHMRGDQGVRNAAARWSRAKDAQRLFEMVSEDLVPHQIWPWVPAPDLPAPFEPVTSIKALKATALEFKNCLADFAFAVLKGRMAVFVWRGEPNAAVALTWGMEGWRLAEAEAADNEELADEPLRQIVAAVQRCGVRVGPCVEAVQQRLMGHASHSRSRTIPEPRRFHSYAEALDLGDLWR